MIWPDGNEQILTNVSVNQVLEIKYKKGNQESELTTKSKVNFQDITQEKGIGYKHIENKFDDYKTQVLLPHKMSTFGPHISHGDVNGDLLEDIYIGGSASNPAVLMLQDRSGSFKEVQQVIFENDKLFEDMGSCFFDADGDGDQDLYVVSGGNEFLKASSNYQDRLYLNDGSGKFSRSESSLPEITISGSKVQAFDFDKDGDQDLIVAGRHVPWSYPEPTSSILLENENGVFKDVTKEKAPSLLDIGMVNDLDCFDYDGDGWEDLVLVGEWMPLTVLKNNEGSFTIHDFNGRDQSTGWWFSVETADMDKDGDLDIVAGNLGLNYKYKATEKEPFEVFYYDFDGNNSKDIVLTYYNFGEQYPLRGKQCSSEQIPSLNEDFETYDLFASSNLIDIYGEEKLETSLHYSANTFANSYFENLGDGNFKQHLLPPMAQLSSINDLILEDYNGDGHLDILAVGNLYNAEVETTRNDAGYGLLMIGDGTGSFKVKTKAEGGFYAAKNAKCMIQIPTSEAQLILVGNNNDALQIFQYRASD